MTVAARFVSRPLFACGFMSAGGAKLVERQRHPRAARLSVQLPMIIE